jgi:hypothetical protein
MLAAVFSQRDEEKPATKCHHDSPIKIKEP